MFFRAVPAKIGAHILGIGIDIVLIDRFVPWLGYAPWRLEKIFTQSELVAFLHASNSDMLIPSSRYAAAHLAVRFAAKEAFYKALSATCVTLEMTAFPFSFFFICKYIEVAKGPWNVPYLRVNWSAIENKIQRKLPQLQAHVSLTHENDHAVANVIISLY